MVYDYCKCKKPVQRLWISSREDAATREDFDRLRPGAVLQEGWKAADARPRAALKSNLRGCSEKERRQCRVSCYFLKK